MNSTTAFSRYSCSPTNTSSVSCRVAWFSCPDTAGIANFTEINGRFNIEAGQLNPTTKDDTWFVSTEFWQYLWTEGAAKQSVDVNDGRQDLQGVGVFSRIQFTDPDTNPLDYSISVGVNAKGLIPGRDNDAMGIAYSYNKLNKGRFLDFVGIADSSSVWEAFYNIELTPAVHLTLDAQVARVALPGYRHGDDPGNVDANSFLNPFSKGRVRWGWYTPKSFCGSAGDRIMVW